MSVPGTGIATRRAALLGLGALALPAWAGAAPAAGPRLLTLGGSLTEIVYALGAQAQLVGADSTSLYPPATARLPKVGYFRQLSAEGILALRPEVVIGTDQAGPPTVLEQLRSAGVRVEQVKLQYNWAELQDKLRTLGQVCARGDAARTLQQRLDAEWQAVQAEVAARRGPRPRVLFVLAMAQAPRAAGLHTAGHAMIEYAGATNAMQTIRGYRELTPESTAQAAPDVIVTVDPGLTGDDAAGRFWQQPGMQLTPAYRKRALITMDAGELLGFGPRMPQAVRQLHRRILAFADA